MPAYCCLVFEVRLELTLHLHNLLSKADLDIVGMYVRVSCLSPRSLHNIHYSSAGLR